MRSSLLSFPSRAVGLRLHARLRAGDDPTIPAEICSAYLAPLLAWLGRCFRQADPHLVESAVHEALLGYLKNPRAYDQPQKHAARLPPDGGVGRPAQPAPPGTAPPAKKNLLEQCRRRPVRWETLWERSAVARTSGGAAGSPGDRPCGGRAAAGRRAGPAGAVAGRQERHRGWRAALGLDRLPALEQQGEVKRAGTGS